MRNDREYGEPAGLEALRASELSYRRLFETAQDGILILDVDTGRIDDVNPFLEKLLGFSRDEMVGRTVGELSPFRDLASNQAMLEELQRNGFVRYDDLPLETKDARRVPVEFVSNVYRAGKRRVIQCNIRDISARKAKEERRRRSQDEEWAAADRANVVKADFLANISHEIRTPMGAILGFADILAETSPLTPEQAEAIGGLQVSASSLFALLNDLLDLSKLESSSIVLEEVPFSLGRVMDEVAGMLAVRAREKGLSFRIDDRALAEDLFLGDPARLRQILLNLCGNALKFTTEGEVVVSLSSSPLRDTTFLVTVAVADTGIGIAPDKIETVFERFVQADTSITRRYGGTGLGLTISRTLAGLMHGTIDASSTPGQGSVFTLKLPLRMAPADSQAAERLARSPAEAPRSVRVLLVEDHEPNIFVESKYLEGMGVSFDVARNGQEALAQFDRRSYGLILLDVQMPLMDGFEVTRRIRSREKQESLPRARIVGMTAHALPGDRQRCLDAGMDDYISKPFNPDELRSKVLLRNGPFPNGGLPRPGKGPVKRPDPC